MCAQILHLPGRQKHRVQAVSYDFAEAYAGYVGLLAKLFREPGRHLDPDDFHSFLGHARTLRVAARFVNRLPQILHKGVRARTPDERTLPGVKGYGRLIAAAREAEGLTQAELARKIGEKDRTIVYRFEVEKQTPTIEQVNRLASALPLSVESLLRAMGANFTPPEVGKLHPRLVCVLTDLNPEALEIVERVANGLHAAPDGRVRP